MIVNQVVMVAIMIAAPLHMHHHGYGLGAVGIVISVHVLGMYALAPLSGYLADRFGSRRVLVAGLLLAAGSAAALVGVPHLTGAGLLVVLFVLGYGWNLSLVGGSATLAREVPKIDQLRVQGIVEAAVWGLRVRHLHLYPTVRRGRLPNPRGGVHSAGRCSPVLPRAQSSHVSYR